MTAPGDSLEFHESAAFAARVLGREEVRALIQDRLRNRPRAGERVGGEIYTLEVDLGDRSFVYIYGRKGQRVNIAYVFELPREAAAFRSRLAEMKKVYGT